MKRRTFLKSFILFSGIASISSAKATEILVDVFDFSQWKNKLKLIFQSLKSEGSSLVKKVLDGKKYIRNPFVHYPFNPAIKDERTNCAFYFHAHRKNEYGHFHTFIYDNDGKPIHLVLISMDEKGKPVAIATVNRWVTGDKYVPAKILKEKLKDFFISPSLFKEPRLIEFVNSFLRVYKKEIFELFDERDKWIDNYAANFFREPFEDRRFEILSYKIISLNI